MDTADLFSLYRQMLLIRRFEEKSVEMYALAKNAGFLHLYIGEEAIAVGAIASLRADDYVIALIVTTDIVSRAGPIRAG